MEMLRIATILGSDIAFNRSMRFVLIFTLLMLAAESVSAVRYLTEEAAKEIAFPNAESFVKRKKAATNAQREQIGSRLSHQRVPRFFEYYEAIQNGRTLGFVVFGNVIGKHQPIDYMVALSPQQKVKSVEILVYRESHGNQIKRENFRRQFLKKSIEDPLRLHREIKNISGATLSCRSIITAVREVLAFSDTLLPRKEKTDVSTADRTEQVLAIEKHGNIHYRKRARLLMGTLLEIQVFSSDSIKADLAITEAFNETARIENELLSSYVPTSEISRFNQMAGLQSVTPSPELYFLLNLSHSIHRDTNGMFDISVGPLINLWKQSERSGHLPSTEKREELMKRIGMNSVEILENKSVRFKKEGMQLNFGGIGKGYALDKAAEVLRRHGINSALLNFGGQYLAMDPPPEQDGWQILIRDPQFPDQLMASVSIANEAIATSADDQRGYFIDGKRYSHIINPKTGKPVQGNLSATVISNTATTVDAWSTALFATHADVSMQWAESHHLDAYLLDDKRRVHSGNSSRFMSVFLP